MIVWFHVTGDYTCADPHSAMPGVESGSTKIEAAPRHYIAIDLGTEDLRRIIS